MLLQGKVVVVTGASMGIGEAIAKLFAAEGAYVVLSSRDISRAEAARGRIGHQEQTMAVACDVRNREEIDRLMSLTMHNYGRVDIWVNNAGHGLLDSVAAMNMKACREMFDTNLFGAVDGMQVAAAQMKQQGGGTIINISSVAGHIPVPLGVAYSATKFAMNAFGKGARLELQKYGINVLTVCPGFIKTNFQENMLRSEHYSDIPKRQYGATAEQVARATLRGYLKGKRQVVVPWYYHIAIKIYQLFPGLVERGLIEARRRQRQTASPK